MAAKRISLVASNLDIDVTLSHVRDIANQNRRRYRVEAKVGPLSENNEEGLFSEKLISGGQFFYTVVNSIMSSLTEKFIAITTIYLV